MKILYLMLSLLNLSTALINEFDAQVETAYNEYIEVQTENPNYTIKLVTGVFDNQVRYGVFFTSEIAKEYHLKVFYKNRLYQLPETNRGDVNVVAIDFEEGEIFSIEIYDKQGHYQYGNEEFKNIKVIAKEEFTNYENLLIGNGMGSSITRLKSANNIKVKTIFIGVLVFILLVCGIIIFIYYKKKRGLFNPDLKKENVFNFKEFLNSEIPTETDDYIDVEVLESETDDQAMTKEDNQDENGFIQNNYIWSHYEEERSNFNIKSYLKDLGYITNYQLASEEEKNQIMLELMKLRDQRKITQDDYLEEISELWKK